LGTFRNETDAQAFQHVCSAHTHVVPAESYSQAGSPEAQLREISALQQRAKALENAVELRKQVEQELVEALRLRDDFLSVAGHELKTPLTALQLQIHSLRNRAREEGLTHFEERLDRARRQTDRLSTLTDELLDVSRVSAGRLTLEREECDLSAIVLDVADRQAETLARARCKLRVLAEEPTLGSWDRNRVEQVVSNLLSNACKYGAGEPVELLVKKVEDRVRLTVRDHGIGVSHEDHSRIFDRFERAASSSKHYGGLGLGLWICRQVVEAHGGTIRVESGSGTGATFTVELPVVSSAAAACAEQA
jgi:signal transduction histidine kinase